MIDIKPTSLKYGVLFEVIISANTTLKHTNDHNECSTTELVFRSNGIVPIAKVAAYAIVNGQILSSNLHIIVRKPAYAKK
jgi:hypothetical protein